MHQSIAPLIVTGFAGHGKDQFCAYLSKVSIRRGKGIIHFKDTSRLLCQQIIYPLWGYAHYPNEIDCFRDRKTKRAVWYSLLEQHSRNDKASVVRQIFLHTDIYCGLRSKEQLEAARRENIVATTVWIDATTRTKTTESLESCTITAQDADVIITNNGTLEQLESKAIAFLSRCNTKGK